MPQPAISHPASERHMIRLLSEVPKAPEAPEAPSIPLSKFYDKRVLEVEDPVDTKRKRLIFQVLSRASEMLMSLPASECKVVEKFLESEIAKLPNPNKELENELFALVALKMPPGEQYYRNRSDKTEMALAFFNRIYGRYHKAGILSKKQLRSMDTLFCNLLEKSTNTPIFKSKNPIDGESISSLRTSAKEAGRVSVAAYRKIRSAMH